jgi:hypothetical protein
MNENAQEFLLTLIEHRIWDRAQWRGCAFFWDECQPPNLAFIFENEQAAKQIFAGLRSKVTADDEEELVRICTIEGSFDSNENAYGVSIGPNFFHVLTHFGEPAEDLNKDKYLTLCRFLRMNPSSLSPLREFKRKYNQFGSCKIVPSIAPSGSLKPFEELSIVKHELIFRKQEEIRPDDEDAISLSKESPRR